jgi:hypothetical protein
MSNDDNWGFDIDGPSTESKKPERGSVLNFGIILVGIALFGFYGIYKLIFPTVEIGADTLSIAANVSGLLGAITIAVAMIRINNLNKRKKRGY